MRKGVLRTAVILSILILLTSCPGIDDYFPEYRGVNLIGEQSFDSGEWAVGHGINWETGGYQYMDIAVSASEGPAVGSVVYRMTAKNLMPDGMFEETISADLWVGDDNSGSDPPISGTDYLVETNYQLYFDITDSQWITFDLTNSINGLYDFYGTTLSNIEYNIKFYYKPVDIDSLLICFDNGNMIYFWRDLNTASGAYANSLRFSVPTTALFSIGYPDMSQLQQANKGYIDNLMICRSDIDYDYYLDLPVADSRRTETPLIEGTYRFSVMVKTDPDAGLGNVFPGKAVTVKIVPLGGSKGSASYSTASESGFSVWTEISVVLSAPAAFQPPETAQTDDIVMRLIVSPTAPSFPEFDKLPGSLLIADPVLEFLPDGE